MDYTKKKLLTQSVSFIQGNLNLSTDLLTSMKAAGIFTQEETSTIQVSTEFILSLSSQFITHVYEIPHFLFF